MSFFSETGFQPFASMPSEGAATLDKMTFGRMTLNKWHLREWHKAEFHVVEQTSPVEFCNLYYKNFTIVIYDHNDSTMVW